MDLKITQLGELLPASLQPARKWLYVLMHYSMGTNIAALSETLAAALAGIWSLSSMPTLMRLRHINVKS